MDTETGLVTLRGDMQKVVHFLHKFATTHADDMDRLKVHLVFSDIAAAENIIHILKGVAGSLGLVDIARQAKEIDQLLRQDNKADQLRSVLDHHVAILAEMLPRTCAALLALPDQDEGYPREMDADLESKLDVLQDLLKRGNYSALGQLQEIMPQLYGRHGQMAQKIEQQIRDFNYDNALQMIEILRRQAQS